MQKLPEGGSFYFKGDELSESEKKELVKSPSGDFYTYSSWKTAETELAKKIAEFVSVPVAQYPLDMIEKYISDGEATYGITLHEQQREAIKVACNNSFFVLTGGPGTGKTTVLKVMVYVLRKCHERANIMFCAPTGKASRRITESTGEQACTLNKILKLSLHSDTPTFIDADILAVDEASMIDFKLMDKLMDSVKKGQRLIFLGDTDQLPSIGRGAILRDLINSDEIAVVHLTKTFRQASESGLMQAIVNIREGKTDLIKMDDFLPYCMDKYNGNTAIQIILRAYLGEVKKYGIQNVCVLVPTRRKGVCSNEISRAIQKVINSSGECIEFHSKENGTIQFHKSDLVMQLENREECANGDVGIVIEIKDNGLVVGYGKTKVTYAKSELDQLNLAYAMTVHKSQGSEYKSVIMVLMNEHKRMLERNIVYTGITRAKENCIYLYQTEAHKEAIRTVRANARITLLAEKIGYLLRRKHI